MTLSVRNGLLALAFSVLLLMAVGYGFLSVSLITGEGWSARIGPVTLWWLLVETVLAVAASLTGFILVRRAYRKSSAPELFFFALFFVAIAGEGLLLAQAWFHYQGSPSWFSATLTRTIWACRFTGLFLLFCGSLFSFEFSYRKYGNLVVASLAAAIFLASSLPLHTTSARNHLLFAIGDAPGVVLFTTLMALVAAANFLIGATRSGTPDQAGSRAWASLFFLAGWAVAIVFAPWGVLLTVPGIFLASWRVEQTSLVR